MQEHLNTHFIMVITRAFVQQGLYIHSRYSEEQCSSTDENVCTFGSPRPRCYEPTREVFHSQQPWVKPQLDAGSGQGLGRARWDARPGVLDSPLQWAAVTSTWGEQRTCPQQFARVSLSAEHHQFPHYCGRADVFLTGEAEAPQ